MMRSFLLVLSILLLGKSAFGFYDSTHVKAHRSKMIITDVLKKYTQKWMKIPGVIGTGEGQSGGKPCIIVLIDHKSSEITKKIPKEAGGYKVVLNETGTVNAR